MNYKESVTLKVFMDFNSRKLRRKHETALLTNSSRYYSTMVKKSIRQKYGGYCTLALRTDVLQFALC